MKKRVVKFSIAIIALIAFGFVSNTNAQGGLEEGDGKCKSDERCWNGNTIECDDLGDGSECACYTC